MSTWTFPFCPSPPDWRLDWPGLELAFPWLAPLRATPQDPLWHAEGDVLTHTRMVLEALVVDPQWRALDEPARHVLFAAALLHDIGKGPTTRTNEHGRVVSPRHTSVGQRMARNLLWSGAAGPAPDFATREAIAALVRYHGLPILFIEKPSPERAVAMASLCLRCDHLAILARADVRGRFCPDARVFLERLELFGEFCLEQGCWDGPKSFASDLHRFAYCTEGRPYHYVPYDDTRVEVTLMAGLPASGKTRWVEQHAGQQAVIRLDDIRQALDVDPGQRQGAVAEAARELARTHLRRAAPLVWDATNTTRMMRGQLITLFVGYKARVRIVYVECPHDELHRRNRARRSPVPTEVIDHLADKLEVPTPDEAHQVIAVAS